jgi:hypothetical protein
VTPVAISFTWLADIRPLRLSLTAFHLRLPRQVQPRSLFAAVRWHLSLITQHESGSWWSGKSNHAARRVVFEFVITGR